MGISRRGFLATPVALAAWQAMRAGERKPNVILIVAGTWRAQAVPWAGDTDVPAPNLARLAAQGVTFSRAYAAYARSERSRLCLLKGVFPHTLAMPDAPVEGPLSEPPTLATVLRGAGYRTASFGTRQADEIVAFVHSQGDAPFYVEWYMENVGSGLMERSNPGDLHVRENVPAELQSRTREDMAVFYARARTRDRDIGEVLEALGRTRNGNDNGLNDDTIVIFTSLHGEQFGSHSGQGDDYVYEETIRIPLAIRYPRVLKGGSQNDILISQVDIMPTLLKWCGATIPDVVEGRDLSALLAGEAGERPEAVYAEGRLGQKDEWRMLVHGYDKLVVDKNEDVTHLFNLADDPYEETNLANVTAELLKRDSLLAMERQWAKKLGDGVDASGLRKR
ncbi:MAG: sulfatase-like hydrolase/transferase [Acidobacteriota bacterium]|nr:sulfatase-like hydrolase/transferase [Acidobacteriota bacterium]